MENVKTISERMKAIGTYRNEFLPTIQRLANLYEEWETIQPTSDDVTDEAMFSKRIKLLNMMLLYERELGLTPAGEKKMLEKLQSAEKKKKSALDEALQKFR